MSKSIYMYVKVQKARVQKAKLILKSRCHSIGSGSQNEATLPNPSVDSIVLIFDFYLLFYFRVKVHPKSFSDRLHRSLKQALNLA